RRRHADGLDGDHRRHRAKAGGTSRARPGPQRGHPGDATEAVPRRGVPGPVRADHRPAQGEHGPKDQLEQRPQGLRRRGVMSSDLADILLWLCSIPSFIGEERALCDAVRERLRALPLAGAIRRYENSLVVPLTRGSGGPHVALVGHLDVVHTEHDGPPRVEGERLYAAGASDMKSGLCLMVDLARRPRSPAVDLTLAFYSRE